MTHCNRTGDASDGHEHKCNRAADHSGQHSCSCGERWGQQIAPDSPLCASESRPTGEDDALQRLALLEAQRQTALAELSRIHRERCEVVRGLNERLSPTQIAGLLGISRQAVHKLLGPVATESCPDDA